MKKEDRKFRLLFDQHPQPMWVLDSDGERFLLVNRAATRLYGYSLKDFRSMRVADVTGAGDGTHRGKGGRIIDAELSLQPIDYDGAKALLAVISHAGSDPLREGQSSDSRKMEDVGTLAGGVAHDFNNLLTIITGYTQMVLENMRPNDVNRRSLEEVIRAGEHAAVLTRQILALGRSETAQPRVVDLNALVTGLVATMRRLLGENIQLRLALGADAGRISADPGHVELVLLTLVLNTRDAMPVGGALIIETAAMELDGSSYVMLAVSGSAGDEEQVATDRLFDSFLSETRSGKSTGLNLTMATAIIRENGGDLLASNEPGRGNTIKAYLPRVGRQALGGASQA